MSKVGNRTGSPKMFRLHRNRPPRSGERVGFKFSNFKATQVPKGWDKLFVSVMSVETGKAIAKSSKSSVKNGSCQWTETLQESLWIVQDESSKELDDCLFKIVIAMGSARSGVLGEATINMTNYMESRDPVPVSLPLKKCNFGTVLQVKIQCLTPRTNLRDDEIGGKSSSTQNSNLDLNSNDGDNNSEGSEGSTGKKAPTSFNLQVGSASRPEAFVNQETSYSSLSQEPKPSIDENNQAIDDGDNSAHDSSNSDLASFNSHAVENSGTHHSVSRPDFMMQQMTIPGSSKSLLQTAEDAIQDLRAESKMWERNAHELMLDLELLRKEFSALSKNRAELDVELSVANTECDCLKKQVEQLKASLERSVMEETSMENLESRNEGGAQILKELEEEIKFQKESNVDLAMQLSRSQESNVELVVVLQELEETVEKQKLEMEKLMTMQSKFGEMENEMLEIAMENKSLKKQLQEMRESEKVLQSKLHELEQALEEEKRMMKDKLDFDSSMVEKEREYVKKLADKEEEIAKLEVKLSESLKVWDSEEKSDEGKENLIKEIETLQEKVRELESDCNELTEENLQLLFKLKETANASPQGGAPVEFSFYDYGEKTLSESNDSNDCANGHEEEVVGRLENLKMKAEQKEECSDEATEDGNEKGKLEEMLRMKDQEIERLIQCKTELEAVVSGLEKENINMQEKLDIMQREGEITGKCLREMQNDKLALRNSVHFHVSASKSLERRSLELEGQKTQLERHVAELEEEKERLCLQLSGLESEIRRLSNDKVLSGNELQELKIQSLSLKEEISRLNAELDKHSEDRRQELLESRSRLAEAQEECEVLWKSKFELESTTEKLIQECRSFEKSNEELRKQNYDLRNQCVNLESVLEELRGSYGGCTAKIEELEGNLSALLEDVSLKERNLVEEGNVLVLENEKQRGELILLNKANGERMIQINELQLEIGHLTEQIVELRAERGKMESEKGELEFAMQETLDELRMKETELNDLQVEFENQKMPLAAEGKLSMQLQIQKSREEKLRTALNELELKLTVSEYERRQLIEESTTRKIHAQKMESLQDQISELKKDLNAAKTEKEKTEALLISISSECKQLKAEKYSQVEKINALRDTVAELELCKKSKFELEQRLLRAQSDLAMKEELCSQAVEVKNEFNQIRRENRQYQRMMQQLEEEKEEVMRRARAHEEELKAIKEERRNQRQPRSSSMPNKANGRVKTFNENTHLAKGDHVASLADESFHSTGVDQRSRTSLPDHEFLLPAESDNRLSTDSRHNTTDAPRKPTRGGELVTRERFERTKSSLESELRDIRERYLIMSLKYAEVEAQREELVMKLKANKNSKKWFS